MRARRTVALALTGLLAAAGLAACGNGEREQHASTSGSAATVLNVGMPNGPQTENNNPFLGSSSGASLGYRWMIFEPLVMIEPRSSRPSPASRGWPPSGSGRPNFTKLVAHHPRRREVVRRPADDRRRRRLLVPAAARTTRALNQRRDPVRHDHRVSGNKVDGDLHPARSSSTRPRSSTEFVVPKHQWSTITDPTTGHAQEPDRHRPVHAEVVHPADHHADACATSYWQDAAEGQGAAVHVVQRQQRADHRAGQRRRRSGASSSSRTSRPSTRTRTRRTTSSGSRRTSASTVCGSTPPQGPFDNPALRRAMNKVINRDDIFNQGEAGYFYPKVEQRHRHPDPGRRRRSSRRSTRTRRTTVDVDGAKKELTDTGFKLDGNTLKDPTGKPVTITLTDPAGWSDYQTDLEIIKDNLSTIGITATVDKANQDAWFKNDRRGQLRRRDALDQRWRDAVRHLPEHHGRQDPASRSARRRRAATTAGSTARRRPRR